MKFDVGPVPAKKSLKRPLNRFLRAAYELISYSWGLLAEVPSISPCVGLKARWWSFWWLPANLAGMSEFYDPRAPGHPPAAPEGNVFITFGFEPDEAKKLLAETDRRIELEIARRKALGLPAPTLPG